MLNPTCDICKKPQINIYQAFIRNVNDITQPTQQTFICETCYNKIKAYASTLGTEEQPKPIQNPPQPKKQEENIENILPERMRPKHYDVSNDFEGMTLRDFLQTPLYLESKEPFVFRNQKHQELIDYIKYMSKKVLFVSPPNDAHSEMIVTIETNL